MSDAVVPSPIARAAPAPATEAARPSMRIVIIGDLHTYRLWAWAWELLGKRMAGQLNLWITRRRQFQRRLIAPAAARAIALKPDLVLFSGDLTTTARQAEFADVARALRPLLQTIPAVVVPGNHDYYTPTSIRRQRIQRAFGAAVPVTFPHSQPLVGGWRLIAVNSAMARMFDSRGQVGPRQLDEVRTLLQSLRSDEGVVLLCHYPFGKPPHLPPMKPGHQLIDRDAWREVVGSCQARMIIVHGHVHMPWLWRPEGMPRVLDVNAGSPTMVTERWPNGQGLWEMTLPADVSQAVTFAHHVLEGGEAPSISGLRATFIRGETREEGWVVRRVAVAADDYNPTPVA